MGSETNSAIAVVVIVADKSARMPNSGGLARGAQVVPKKSASETLRKNGSDSANRK
jgi:hypothetical protein